MVSRVARNNEDFYMLGHYFLSTNLQHRYTHTEPSKTITRFNLTNCQKNLSAMIKATNAQIQ